ncbi:LLM class flavin-dependent oxidoreductase [Goodfellowiella coeruleoviolacea]|uniref:Alkanesulfonate monooxygenase n=1 Tax=Goodfellowiella coeruleoviolacea TaxID=334858 RepID=A0AAE3G7P8_9PSEU|nr:LLM class flavin-dependent oxidoreductase [Goodfellowiella coeruleoviolacea]MCP2163172.1 alkanesulfonate monooxygenase [Goodfellowiella coeruleoviolacea]
MSVELTVYGTALPGRPSESNSVVGIGELAQRAERYGYEGLLVFYNHENLDPWIVAATILQQTKSLVPLVAVQPYALPPFTAAKMLHGLACLHHRRLDVNLITGGIRGELDQVGDRLDHDERYARAVEYISVVRALLSSSEPLDHNGKHYHFHRLLAHCALEEALRPKVFVAGSSDAGRAASVAVADVAVTHPEPVAAFAEHFAATRRADGQSLGIRVGLIARETDEQAWQVAAAQYVPDRRSRHMTMLKTRSESDWNRRMARLAVAAETYDDVYWTGAYRADRGLMPLLVGSYDRVSEYLGRYLALGVRTLLLGGVLSEEEFRHCDIVLSQVRSAC